MPDTLTFEFAAVDNSIKGYLSVLIDGKPVWPYYRIAGGTYIAMDQLLPYLTRWFQNFSRDTGNRWHEELVTRLSNVYTSSQSLGINRELLIEFKNLYNMSAGSNVYIEPELWVSPQGSRFILECENAYAFPLEVGLDALTTLGQLVSQKLRNLGGYDQIVTDWDKR